MQLFSADGTMFIEKTPSKVAHNRARPFFSVLPIGPNPAQIPILEFFVMTVALAMWPQPRTASTFTSQDR
mgnify:CR=1 FL=1